MTAESAWWGDVTTFDAYARARAEVADAVKRGAPSGQVDVWLAGIADDEAQAERLPFYDVTARYALRDDALAIAQYAREYTEDGAFTRPDGASTRPDDPLDGTAAGVKDATNEVVKAIPTPILVGAGVYLLLGVAVFAFVLSRK